MSEQPSRIKPLARRLDSLSGSPPSGPTRLSPFSARPKTAVNSDLITSKIAPKQPTKAESIASSPGSAVKQESDMSVRDILGQARRREAEAQARKEANTVPSRNVRKQVIRTDIGTTETGQAMLGGFLADTAEDIDLEGDQHVYMHDENSSRCCPVKIPFFQTGKLRDIPDEKSLTGSEDLILFQLPSLFPTLKMAHKSSSEEPQGTPRQRGSSPRNAPKAAPQVRSSVGTPFSDIPDGKIGTLKVHKSGKTFLHVGDTRFIVNEGQPVGFRTEVACLCPGESEIIFMGQAFRRVVVSPMIN